MTSPGTAPEDRFRALFEASYDDVRRFVRRRAEPDDVDDVVSETYLVAWRRLDVVPIDTSDARAWLFTTARHVQRTQVRSTGRRTALVIRAGSDPGAGAGSTDPAATVPARADLARALARLSDADQEAIVLHAWDGLSQTEAAGVLGISTSAYSVRLTRARGRLRAALETPTVRSL